jgi:DAK2 domain fusion protein YloV
MSSDLNNGQWDDMMNMVEHPQADGMVGEGAWGYDVQFLIKARLNKPLDLSKIRLHIERIGDCPLVVGDEQLLKVHLHCPNPGIPITYAAEQGSISDVVVEDMDAQAEAFLQQPTSMQDNLPPLFKSAQSTDEVTGIGLVAVAPGEGIANIFRSLGVSQIIHGGQTMNPSIKELLQAIETFTAETVMILPNNKNIILTANQLPTLTSKKVYILPTRTIPQGIAAVMGFNYAGDVEENYATMQDAMTYVQTGEVTIATRSTTVDDLAITEGDIIGLLNGQLIVAAQSPELVIRSILQRLDLSNYEVITFYYGEQITPEEAQALLESLKTDYDQQDIDVFSGGQPHYHYIFSVE